MPSAPPTRVAPSLIRKTALKHFRYSILVSVLGLSAAYYWSGAKGMLIAATLGLLEVSLSFDNAVVNAAVLKTMSEQWRRRFLTWGLLFAVFGVRFLLPLLIVAVVTHRGLGHVAAMALHEPREYARHLTAAHVQIAAFGAMYLLLVFLSFHLQHTKTRHWLEWIERRLVQLGKLESMEIVLALAALIAVQYFLPDNERLSALLAGLAGIILFVTIKGVSGLLEAPEHAEQSLQRGGLMSFIYLEVLDLSFSFDSVIGAFAITRNIVIIMVGLAIGAMFVRSMTILLVHRKTLDQYVFVEHGAHYAIGALAVLMLLDLVVEVSEFVTGSTGIVLILLSLWSSIRYRRKHRRSHKAA